MRTTIRYYIILILVICAQNTLAKNALKLPDLPQPSVESEDAVLPTKEENVDNNVTDTLQHKQKQQSTTLWQKITGMFGSKPKQREQDNIAAPQQTVLQNDDIDKEKQVSQNNAEVAPETIPQLPTQQAATNTQQFSNMSVNVQRVTQNSIPDQALDTVHKEDVIPQLPQIPIAADASVASTNNNNAQQQIKQSATFAQTELPTLASTAQVDVQPISDVTQAQGSLQQTQQVQSLPKAEPVLSKSSNNVTQTTTETLPQQAQITNHTAPPTITDMSTTTIAKDVASTTALAQNGGERSASILPHDTQQQNPQTPVIDTATTTINNEQQTKTQDNQTNKSAHKMILGWLNKGQDQQQESTTQQDKDTTNVAVNESANDAANSSATPSNDEQIFADNEAILLTLPNDDVILGVLSNDAKIEQMDFSQYLLLLRKTRRDVYEAKQGITINNFIVNIQNDNNVALESDYNSSLDIFAALAKGDLFTLRVLLDNYSLLQIKDSSGNGLLHLAAKFDNNAAAQLLLMRGIDISGVNTDYKTALMIARDLQSEDIAALLMRAGAKN